MKSVNKTFLSLLLLTLLAACKSAASSPPALLDITWKLESYLDAQGRLTHALPEGNATLKFGAEQVSGSTGCNRYFADYQLDGEKLTLGLAGSTEMACEEPRMAQEMAFLAALAQATSYRLSGGKLELLDAAGKVQLTFSELKPLPLVGTNWVMTTVYNGKGVEDVVTSPAAGVEVTAVFGADGKLSGNAGCNSYSGDYKLDGEKLTIGPLVSTLMACADSAAMEQESAFLQALQQAATFKVSSSSLEMRDANGALLVSFSK